MPCPQSISFLNVSSWTYTGAKVSQDMLVMVKLLARAFLFSVFTLGESGFVAHHRLLMCRVWVYSLNLRYSSFLVTNRRTRMFFVVCPKCCMFAQKLMRKIQSFFCEAVITALEKAYWVPLLVIYCSMWGTQLKNFFPISSSWFEGILIRRMSELRKN